MRTKTRVSRTVTQLSVLAELAYRGLVDHTIVCRHCKAGAPCAVRLGLNKAWKKLRG
ncbi:hypothetical protein [Streptomyces sp. NPDC058620]|uniref:hypothetical protein n=1 Tax=Streptomyces sp. NPDC058620 TaxID=3346560 RepID=UPI00365D239F